MLNALKSGIKTTALVAGIALTLASAPAFAECIHGQQKQSTAEAPIEKPEPAAPTG